MEKTRAIQQRGFIQLVRDVAEVLDQGEDDERTREPGDDHRPVGVLQVEISDDDVQRDHCHFERHEQSDQDKREQPVLLGKLQAGEEIGAHGVEDQTRNHHSGGDDERVHQVAAKVEASPCSSRTDAEDVGVMLERPFDRKEGVPAQWVEVLEDLGLPAQTAKNHPDERDQEKQADNSEEHGAQDGNPALPQPVGGGAVSPGGAGERGSSVLLS
jgi:hypothetical protein